MSSPGYPHVSDMTAVGRERSARRCRTLLFAAALPLAACAQIAPEVTGAEVMGFTASLAVDIARSSPPFDGILDADQAVARAITFNHTVRAARLEAFLSDAKRRVEAGELLPDILADSDYYRRDRPAFSHSSASPAYSTSSDLATLTKSIELSFNILDFGLTLVRVRQAADRANQKYEEVRKTALRISEETRVAFWKAVALQSLAPALARLEPEIADAMRLSRRASADSALDPLDAINFQRDLLNARREVNDLYAQISGAGYELRTLTAIEAEAPLRLAASRHGVPLVQPGADAGDDVARALRQRPEIRQIMYDMRISDQEVRAQFLKLLPGATLTQSRMSDSNSFLLHGDWVSWSARVAVNLMDAARFPGRVGEFETEQELNRQKGLVTAAAIALQVHVARARLAVQQQVYRDAEEFAQSQRALLRQVTNAVAAGSLPEQMTVRERLAALLAEVRAILAFGDLHAAAAAYEAATADIIPPQIAYFNE